MVTDLFRSSGGGAGGKQGTKARSKGVKRGKKRAAKPKPKAEAKKAAPTGGGGGAITSTDDFAARAKEALDRVPRGLAAGDQAQTFGDHKVFLGAVREQMGISKPEFQRWALAAQREGKITMTRFDLAGALSDAHRGKVYADEIKHDNAEFHFMHRGR